jgi:glycosyltransferase involved in cell wall biosynthesis
MAPIISVVTTCKGRLEHLKTTLPAMLALPDCEVIVVDYDCPDGTGAWVRANFPAAKVVQVTERPLFNTARARNLGAAAATAPWLLMLDADVIATPGLAEAVRDRVRPGRYLLPEPRPPELYGALVVARADFEAIGGYDENFEGWGSEDVDITRMLDLAGRTAWPFPGDLLSGLPHGDALRVRFHEIADRDLNWAINAFYSHVKIDLRRVGMSLNPEQSRNLYAGARKALLSADGAAQLNVVLPERTVAGNRLEATITYRLSGPGIPGGVQS